MKKFFQGISFSQILAGALAAVTSFLLAAKIGIAGSVIGVAIGSIVSAIASQIYQNVFKESSKKIQVVGSRDQSDDDGDAKKTEESDRSEAEGESTEVRSAASHADNEVDADSTIVVSSADVESADSTEVLEPSTSSAQDNADSTSSPHPRVISSQDVSGRSGAHGSAVTGADIIAQRRHRQRRNAIIVAVVSGLVATLISAGVVLLVTNGHGTDDVVRTMVNNSRTERRDGQSRTPDSDDRSSSSVDSPSPDSTDSSSPSSDSSDSSTSTSSPTATSSPSATSSTSTSSPTATSSPTTTSPTSSPTTSSASPSASNGSDSDDGNSDATSTPTSSSQQKTQSSE